MKKVLVIIGDGMSDEPVDSLGGRTPMEVAETPVMDDLAQRGTVGLTCNVPEGMEPGSDVAIMSILGYDPSVFYTGRGPLEAASMGVGIAPGETAFRCNLITLDGDSLLDYSAGHITTGESAQLLAALKKELDSDSLCFHHGVSFRNLMVARGDFSGVTTHAPHDHMDEPWAGFLPSGPGADTLLDVMERARSILADHLGNRARAENGKRPANAIWPWSGGGLPAMTPFKEKYGLAGGVVSAVDLVQGLGKTAGLDAVAVEGATGLVDTNYGGKVSAALKILADQDFALVHLEGPDEAGHMGDPELKIEGIRRLDELVVRPLADSLLLHPDYLLLILPDHPTPLRIRTHTSEPVPFIAVSSDGLTKTRAAAYTEREAAATGVSIRDGHTLLGRLLRGDI